MSETEPSLEYTAYVDPGKPDIDGAIKALERWRDFAEGSVLNEVEKILNLLRPEPSTVYLRPSYDHRGHWKAPESTIRINIIGIKDPFDVVEVWAYDQKEVERQFFGRHAMYSDGPLEIWGRMIISRAGAEALISGEDERPQYFDLTASGPLGESKFLRCKMRQTTTSDVLGDLCKVDFIALREENFGYTYPT